jgi:hypothetical protein
MWVIGHSGNSVHINTKERIRKLAAKRGITTGTAALLRNPTDCLDWIKNPIIVHMDEVRGVELTDEKKREKKPTIQRTIAPDGSLCEYNNSASDILAWVAAGEPSVERSLIGPLAPYRVINLPKIEQDKFRKNHPDVPEFANWFRIEMQNIVRDASEWTLFDMSCYGSWQTQLSTLQWVNQVPHSWDIGKIMDPDLASLLRSRRDSRTNRSILLSNWNATERIARSLNIKIPTLPTTTIGERIATVERHYPLLAHSRFGLEPQAVYDYLNSMYIVREQLHVTSPL